MDPAPGIADNKLLIELNAAGSNPIEDSAGNKLDGYWVNPTSTTQASSSTYPSGNGTPGTNFLFRFNMLPGDVDQMASSRRTMACWSAGPLGQRRKRATTRLSKISTATARLRLPTARR